MASTRVVPQLFARNALVALRGCLPQTRKRAQQLQRASLHSPFSAAEGREGGEREGGGVGEERT